MKYSFGLAWTLACALTLYPSIPVFAEVSEYALTPEQQAQATLQQNQFLQAQWMQAQYMQQQQAAYQAQMQAQAQAKAQAEAQAAQAAAAAKPHIPSDYELQEQAIQKGLAENKTPKVNREDFAQPSDQRWYPQDNNSGFASTGSKARKTAGAAGKVIARGAAVALPTVGLILMSRAMMRGSMLTSR